jgi:hypothetical protein
MSRQVISWHLSAETEEKNEKHVGIAGVQDKIQKKTPTECKSWV